MGDMAIKNRSERAKIYPFNSWRDFTPMNTSTGTMLHNLTGSWRFIRPFYEDKIPACQNACPCGNDIEAWIKLVQKGETEKAYWHLKREQPFPAILGRVCFKFCETACNRTPLDAHVGINELERYIGDQVPLDTPHPELPTYHGKSLAVIGSGPAGMSAGYYARLLGFRVTIYERYPEPGGILRMGIPQYRLPKEILHNEFEGLKKMGIEIRTGTTVGKDISLEQLHGEYDYLFLATGVHGSLKLGVDGEESSHVMSGLELLKKAAFGEKIDVGKRVVVVGGGNTAIDAARTAIRLGAEVIILYRRSEKEMPAHPEEIQEAREEGVQFHFLASPERIELGDGGNIERLVCSEMKLGPPDDSGRRRPVKREGSSFELKADTVLTAIGEMPICEYGEEALPLSKGVLAVDEGLMVKANGFIKSTVFAGGDIIDIPHTVVHAVASGKKAAIVMDCHRQKRDATTVLEEITVGEGPAVSFSRYVGWQPLNPVQQNLRDVVDQSSIVYDYFEKVPPVVQEVQAANQRNSHFGPYRRTLHQYEAQEESDRCLHCGRCTECDNCLILCPDMSVLVKGDGEFGYRIDYDYCKGCGICFTECPRNAISMSAEVVSLEEEG